MAKIENKSRVLFWLKRRLKALEAKIGVDHEALARHGVPYADRVKAEEQAAKATDEQKAELDSYREAIRFIEENAE